MQVSIKTMTTHELTAFHDVLVKRHFELERGTRDRDILAVEPTADELDRTQQASEHDFAVSSIQRNATQLALVADALDRIREGTYGICASCEDEIRLKRLAAIPWANCCIACQEAADLAQDSPSGVRDSQFDIAA